VEKCEPDYDCVGGEQRSILPGWHVVEDHFGHFEDNLDVARLEWCGIRERPFGEQR